MSTNQALTRLFATTQNVFPRVALGLALAAITCTGCNKNNATNPDGTVANANDPNAQDPSLANTAPVDDTQPTQQQAAAPSSAQRPTQVAGYRQQAQPSQQSYSSAAPVERRSPSSANQYSDPNANDQNYNDQSYHNGQNYNDDYDAENGYNATLADVSAPQPPPPLPVYEQPEAPDANYLWTPGYWNYAPQGYYWVPGAWAQPPYTGALWTPGYWGGYGDGYRFHRGFWAAHIGFYGGINYGFGYVGSGYQGGYWNGDNFYYNRAVNRVNENVIHNVYQRNVVINNTVINNRTVNNTVVNNVSYNGGRGGIQAQPRPAELAVLREQRTAPMLAQVQHQQEAAQNRQQFFSANQGRPAQVVAARPLVADRGISAPPHTTAQLNRSLPVAQQIRQEQQFVRPANVQRPTSVPVAAQQNLPARINPTQAQQRQQAVPQNRPGAINEPNRTTIPAQAANRSVQPQPGSAQRPAVQQRPQEDRPGATQVRPAPQQGSRATQQQLAHQPVQTVRPQPPQQSVRPQTEARQPAPQARPQIQQSRPQPQGQSRPQHTQPQPQQQPHAAEQPHAESHPDAHPHR